MNVRIKDKKGRRVILTADKEYLKTRALPQRYLIIKKTHHFMKKQI